MPQLRVALNAQLLSFARSYRSGGISRYIYNLLVQLRQLEGPLRYDVFLGPGPLPPELAPTPRFRVHQTRVEGARRARRILWEQFVQPIHAARLGVDVLHSLSYVQPLLWPRRSVITIFDCSFLRLPEAFHRANRIYLRWMTAASARRADHVITISEHTRQDVIRLLGVPPTRVTAALCATDPIYRPLPPEEVARFRAAQALPAPYIFYLGTLEPRKNVVRLLEAYARLRQRGITEYPLVLAGAKGWGYEQIFARVRELGLVDQVRFVGYVPYEAAPLWYNAAALFVYPSLYEGFGLPPLEAMACGTPVVASNSSSLPEVLGEAALLIDPLDVEALAEAMASALRQPALLARLRQAGLARAACFSWRRMAEQTMAVYHLVGGNR